MLHLHSPEVSETYVLVETSTFPLFWVKHEPSSTDNISKYFYKRNNNDSFFLSKSAERVLMLLFFVYSEHIYIWCELLTDSQYDWNTVDMP